MRQKLVVSSAAVEYFEVGFGLELELVVWRGHFVTEREFGS